MSKAWAFTLDACVKALVAWTTLWATSPVPSMSASKAWATKTKILSAWPVTAGFCLHAGQYVIRAQRATATYWVIKVAR